MADAITIKALQDASLDAKSLEEVVNGSETKQVTTRLGENYPSVKKAIKTLFENGGLPATPFATKALMTASALVDGQYAMVTDDSVAANNVLYVKTDGAWVKSAYDPLGNAIAYSKTKSEISDSPSLLDMIDADGKLYLRIDNTGHVVTPHLDGSIQDNINRQNKIAGNDADNDLLNAVDKYGELFLKVTQDGTLHVNNIATSAGNINQKMQSLSTKDDVVISSNSDVLKYVDSARTVNTEPEIIEHILVDRTETEGFFSIFAPSIIRIAKTKFYLVFDARATGHDYDDIKVAGRIIDYDPESKSFTKGEIKDLAVGGYTSEGLNYTFLNPNVTYVEFGKNAGRIIVHFNYMTNPTGEQGGDSTRVFAPYYVYSDNGGETFTDPIDMTDMFPLYEWSYDGALNFGPGHGIQVRNGEYKGRLIFPAYQRHPTNRSTVRAIYSDDGGDTFQWGDAVVEPSGLNEWQLAEVSDGVLVGIFRLLSLRNYKYIAYSYDGGVTFEGFRIIEEIKGAGVKPALVNCENPYDYSTPKLVFVMPSDNEQSGEGRVNAHVWVSYDEGRTWPIKKQITDNVAHYSDATHIEPDYILTVTGGGAHSRGNQAIAKLINLKFLLEK